MYPSGKGVYHAICVPDKVKAVLLRNITSVTQGSVDDTKGWFVFVWQIRENLGVIGHHMNLLIQKVNYDVLELVHGIEI